MKVLLIGNYTNNVGGISQVIKIQMKLFEDNNIYFDFFNTKKSPTKRIFLFFKLFKILNKFDIIHVHCCSGLGFYPAILTVISNFFTKKKVYLSYHGGNAKYFFKNNMIWLKFFFNRINTIFVMSNFLIEAFNKHRINPILLKNPIDLELIERDAFNNDKIHFLSIRNHEDIYNVDKIIKVFNKLHTKHKNIQLSIIGKGSQSDHCQELSKMSKNNIYIGFIPRTELKTLLLKTDVIVSYPSIDNQPMSILEGIATSNLIVSSDVGGVRDLIPNEHYGVLVEPNSIEELERKIEEIILNPLKCRTIIKNSKQILDFHSQENFYKTLINNYNK